MVPVSDRRRIRGKMQKKPRSTRATTKPAASGALPRKAKAAVVEVEPRSEPVADRAVPVKVRIAGYKSIEDVELDLGRVTVLIGENGCGKTNILEALALAGAAAGGNLRHEFLASRGVRTTEPRFMRSAFPGTDGDAPIAIESHDASGEPFFSCSLTVSGDDSSAVWLDFSPAAGLTDAEKTAVLRLLAALGTDMFAQLVKRVATRAAMASAGLSPDDRSALFEYANTILPRRRYFADFLLFAPENTALRTFQAEGQVLPLGVKGEGLFAHLRDLAKHDALLLEEIIERLSFLEWFERFEIPKDLGPGERSLWIRDRYLAEGAVFDQRSANEGFLMLLFYLTLFTSPRTPRFFAIDNVDAALNPKLCSRLMETLIELAKKHGKQFIVTTHNPALLDGLNLHDDAQRLYVIERDRAGRTRARRVRAPRPVAGEPPVKLSEAFLRGYVGGLPKNF
jgi:predicted ATPase